MSRRSAALSGALLLPLLVSGVSTAALPAAAQGTVVSAAHTSTATKAKAKKTSAKKSTAKKATAKKTTAKKAAVKKKTTKTPRKLTRADASPFVHRAVAGAADVRDTAGQTWSGRPAGWGSWSSGSVPLGTDVARTADDAVYRKTAPGTRWYRTNVPARTTYSVRLLFTESWFDRAGQRVFDVRAEGRTVARDIDVVKAVGKNAAYDVRFTVPVSDGRLDVEFVAKKDQPILSGIEVISTAAVAPAPAPLPKVAISPSSFYYTDISNAPLASNSDAVSANLLRQVKDHWGGVAAFNAYRYNNSFYEVGPNQKKIRVEFYDCQRKGYVPGGLYDGAKHFVDVPIPPNAVPATGTDKELTIYDRSADKLWEFWVTEKTASGGWRACWGGRIDDVSKNQGVFPSPQGATASGLAMAPGVISIDEFRRGRIDHAMYLAVLETQKWGNWSWPANRTDGGSNDPNALMEGQRIRLDPTLDLSTIPMTPVARMVAKAAQQYGFVITDRAGAVAVVTESGNAEKARTGVNPWDGMLAGPDYQAMQGFPWEHMQVLPKDYGKPTS